jgi:hypothetical protein
MGLTISLTLAYIMVKRQGIVNEISKMAVYFNPAIYNGDSVYLGHFDTLGGLSRFLPFF